MKALYESYRAWCEQSGFRPKPISVFGKELSRKGYDPIKRKEGNYRRGLALKLSAAISNSEVGLSAQLLKMPDEKSLREALPEMASFRALTFFISTRTTPLTSQRGQTTTAVL